MNMTNAEICQGTLEKLGEISLWNLTVLWLKGYPWHEVLRIGTGLRMGREGLQKSSHIKNDQVWAI